MPARKWTRERIELELRRLDSRGERLTGRRLRRIGLGGMVTTAYRLFGTWGAALEAAGVEAPKRRRVWTRDRLVAQAQRMAAEGAKLSHASVLALHPELVRAAARDPELGSWGAVLEAAGLGAEAHAQRRAWTREQVLTEIRAMAARGEGLSYGAARARDPKLVAAASRDTRFGSWAAAVEAAGFEYAAHRRREPWSPQRVVAEIQAVAAQGLPLSTRWLQANGWSSLVAVARRPGMFGSWANAVECAGFDYETARQAARAWVKREAANDRTAGGNLPGVS